MRGGRERYFLSLSERAYGRGRGEGGREERGGGKGRTTRGRTLWLLYSCQIVTGADGREMGSLVLRMAKLAKDDSSDESVEGEVSSCV